MPTPIPTEQEVFSEEVAECITVTAHVGHGRTVAIQTEGVRANCELTFEPDEARALAAALLKAADAASDKIALLRKPITDN